MRFIVVGHLAIVLPAGDATATDACVDCHKGVTPNIVKDWELSLHAAQEVGCETCHGSDYDAAANAAEAEIPILGNARCVMRIDSSNSRGANTPGPGPR